MTRPAPDQVHVDIRVECHLDDHWSERLGCLTVTRNADGTTTLTGRLADHAQLYGVLSGLRDIGATLLSLEVDGSTHQTIHTEGEGHDHPAD
jgi:hypothetical protein